MALETDPVKLRALADYAEAFAKEHIVEMCEEMLEWTNTTTLRSGFVRQLAHICKPIAGPHALSLAESYVKNAAFEFVAQQGKASE
jgi:hypothetical protein